MGFDTTLIHLFLIAVSFVVVVDALLSWLAPDVEQPPRLFTHAIAGPLRQPFRRLLPPSRFGGIDVSWTLAFGTLTLIAGSLPPPS